MFGIWSKGAQVIKGGGRDKSGVVSHKRVKISSQFKGNTRHVNVGLKPNNLKPYHKCIKKIKKIN